MIPLNNKEEVIDIELTSHGKMLLMDGTLEPAYCAFFDDEIIYNDADEQQNDIKNRLLEKTLVFQAKTNTITKQKSLKQNVNFNNNLEYNADVFLLPLGNSKISTNYIPSWNLKILKGEIIETQDLSYKTQFTMKDSVYQVNLNNASFDTNYSSMEIDGNIITVKDDYILMELIEENVEDLRENFEIEIFEVMGDEQGSLKKLLFNAKQTNVVDEILLDDKDLPSIKENVELTNDYVQHYFDVYADSEIDRVLIETRQKAIETYRTNIMPNAPTKEDC